MRSVLHEPLRGQVGTLLARLPRKLCINRCAAWGKRGWGLGPGQCRVGRRSKGVQVRTGSTASVRLRPRSVFGAREPASCWAPPRRCGRTAAGGPASRRCAHAGGPRGPVWAAAACGAGASLLGGARCGRQLSKTAKGQRAAALCLFERAWHRAVPRVRSRHRARRARAGQRASKGCPPRGSYPTALRFAGAPAAAPDAPRGAVGSSSRRCGQRVALVPAAGPTCRGARPGAPIGQPAPHGGARLRSKPMRRGGGGGAGRGGAGGGH